MIVRLGLLLWATVAVANHAPHNVDFAVSATIPHDHNPSTAAVTVSLPPVAIDADGDPITYVWRCPSPLLSHPARVDVLEMVFPAQGTYACSLVASDPYGASTKGTVTVNIAAEPNTTPVANAGADTSWTIPHDESPVTNTAACLLDGTASQDADGDELTWSWNCASGTAVATGPTATVYLPKGTHTCVLTVKDPYSATHTDTVQVVVAAEPNAAPVAHAGPDATYTVPHDFYPSSETDTVRVVLDGTQTADADGDRMEHDWDCGGTPKVVATVRLPYTQIMGTQGPDKTQPARLGTWPGDGDDTTFPKLWTGAGNGDTFSGKWTHQANKVTVTLPKGTHTCTLTTKDTYGATSTDSVVITVNPEPNTNPNAAAG